ncbi:MAG: hypothetical protein QMD21_05535 [Candidatus Thermoplasmatota archaeon]|nr:hypothetical protein [Candidatus Thermoplasmatota archaeon]MDI6856225.1 hypothetical protein [Candidatus Thermoplasmatota archaeon]
MREYKVILALIILTALLSGIIYFKFPAIMGAHALSVALWAVLCAEILAFIKR